MGNSAAFTRTFIRIFSNKTLKTKTNVGPIQSFRSKVKVTKNAKTAHNVLIYTLDRKKVIKQMALFLLFLSLSHTRN